MIANKSLLLGKTWNKAIADLQLQVSLAFLYDQKGSS